MKRLSLIDSAFLMLESRETPMHVGGFNLFTLPDGADEQEFLHGLADGMRTSDSLQSPFGDKLKVGRLGLLGPLYWEEDTSLDLEYHIRHSALPKPGRFRELFALVSRLHGTLLDRNRPLWELHLIEGLQNRQFAVYSKFHHAAIDGVRSIHLTQSMYSHDPNERIHDSPLSITARERYLAAIGGQPPSEQELRNVAEALKSTFDSSAHLLGALRKYMGAWTGSGGPLVVPWQNVPQSTINTRVDGARRFVAQSWPFARIRAVGKALDGTFNDAVLAMSSGALRRFLLNHGELPRESLKAMVPVSLRRPGDVDSSNAVGAISADLATNIADPVKRLQAIKASMEAGKAMFKDLSTTEASVFLQLMQLPGLVLMPLGLGTRFPPYSTVISNVPGPRQPMYWNGAKLEGIYPASIVTEGIAMNITLVTYDQQVDFGIMACRRSLPQVQRFIDYLEDSLVELEDAVGISSQPARKAAAGAKARSKPAAKSKATAKPQVKAKAKAKTKAKPKPKPKAKAKAKAKAKVKSKANPKAKTPVKAKAGTKTRAAVTRSSKAKARPKARPKTAASR
ncbi:MAG: wax ester/triacylglycerol synthase family O-acyltransferase [Halieaceae bacterium]|nr:wax ester/triacylglycerol synthase family O-acyltransferase [Halieaceae bacterium]